MNVANGDGDTTQYKVFVGSSEMEDPDLGKFDLARLQAELDQEMEMKELLEESVSDLRNTMADLEDRLHSVEGEGNEWKTRYETQLDLNGQLERQIAFVHGRLEDLRGNPMDRLASIRSYDAMSEEALKHHLKLLTTEKSNLHSQLLDLHTRIQQEGKAYQKTNEERRAYIAEIAKVSSTLDMSRKTQLHQPRENGRKPVRSLDNLPHRKRNPKGKTAGATGASNGSRLPRLKR
ncbi:coiled-coil domain containing 169 isoform X2 [Alosa alosa]|uniref:coiled-coil domain containing 169 isoform X2 n=1 Tax=Alosa sapidissima TaxID=34773 RepID=UPI001C09391A|nr:coiled-coil domain containing 169 isoform X2 [Alosa sapidissima]XP_048093469.1 coiled-coil domain containing 169 isoform X2 [Alosa alosa]